MNFQRTSAKKKAKELAKYLRNERPDYNYLKTIFRHLREELEVEVDSSVKKLPHVPTEEEIRRYYEAVKPGMYRIWFLLRLCFIREYESANW
jgi:integrase/recombinase XerD